jgi:Icc-related predicted phosphoesterase
MDLVPFPHPGESPNVGDVNLLTRVMDVKPALMFFGHIHEGYGSYKHPVYQTQFYNVSICDGSYQPVNPITVVDI